MQQKMEWRNDGIYINDQLAWVNPTPGRYSNVSAHHDGNELWVNGELVYDSGLRLDEPQCLQQLRAHESVLRLGASSKWILTLSNLLALWPIWCAVYWSDALLLGLACCCSVLHHAAEMRYYAPVLIYFSPRARWWLFRGDQLAAAVAILGLGSLALLRDRWLLVTAGAVFMLGSEAVMYLGPECEQWIVERTVLHLPWHFLSLGPIAWLAVTVYAREERLYQTLLAFLL
jgi:hypothetical protein